MARQRKPARVIFAVGFAAAIGAAPAVAALAESAHAVADTNNQNCTINQHAGSASLNCAPSVPTGAANLPSEQNLTQQNEHRSATH